MTFDPIGNPIDYILLDNQRSPGIAVVTAASSPRRWDERRGYAQTGARLIFRGRGLARPIVTLKLYTNEHWAAWHEWRPLVTFGPSPAVERARRAGRQRDAFARRRDEILREAATNPTIFKDEQTLADLQEASSRATQVIPYASNRPRALDIWHPILEDLEISAVVVEDVLQPKQTADGEWSIDIKFIEHRPPVLGLAEIDGSGPAQGDRFEQVIAAQNAENQRLAAERDSLL